MHRTIFNTSLRKFPRFALCNRYDDWFRHECRNKKKDHFSLAYAKIVQESVETRHKKKVETPNVKTHAEMKATVTAIEAHLETLNLLL